MQPSTFTAVSLLLAIAVPAQGEPGGGTIPQWPWSHNAITVTQDGSTLTIHARCRYTDCEEMTFFATMCDGSGSPVFLGTASVTSAVATLTVAVPSNPSLTGTSVSVRFSFVCPGHPPFASDCVNIQL